MRSFNISTRRGFIDHASKVGLGVALASLTDIPLVLKRALAENATSVGSKKLLFMFLRGGDDALNSVIPVGDSAYTEIDSSTGLNKIRPEITIPLDPAIDYSTSGPCDFPVSDNADPDRYRTFHYTDAIRLGNGFSALNPALKFLAPVYNAGDLALIHRVGYPNQSRSHFAGQALLESGAPYNHNIHDGVFYRALVESGLATGNPIAGVSVQSALPLLLAGADVAMTNLIDPSRLDLMGVPYPDGRAKMLNAVDVNGQLPRADKRWRTLLDLQYENLFRTREIISDIDFTEAANEFRDDVKTDNDADFRPGDADGYYLFPTHDGKNGGYERGGGGRDFRKWVVDNQSYEFFESLKTAALLLNKTDAVIAGTQLEGFDTHSGQGGVRGAHATLNRRIAWSIYALRKYFTRYCDRVSWDDLIVVTLSEFGRTTVQNSNLGTDHGIAGMMMVAGGSVKGYGNGNPSGIFGGNVTDPIPWIPGPVAQGGGVDGSMFGVAGRYLKRVYDYRSVLGEIIRKHFGTTDEQLNRIIPGYSVPGEALRSGGTSSVDGTETLGEVGIL